MSLFLFNKSIVELQNIIIFIFYLPLLIWLIYSIRVVTGRTKLQNYLIFENIPNVFVTLGLLGTFLGIAYGLYHFDTTPDNIKTSIQELLSGLRFAFFSSIAGIILSLIFGRIIKTKIEQGFVQEMPTPEHQILLSIEEDHKGSNHLLNEILYELRINNKKQADLKDSFDQFALLLPSSNAAAITKALQEVIEDFNDTFKNFIGQLVDKNFEKLTESIDRLIEWQIDYREEIIEIKETYESIADNHKQFVEATEDWVSNLDRIAGKSSELKMLVEDFQAAFNDESRFKDLIVKIFSATDNLKLATESFKNYSEKINDAELAFTEVSENVESWLNKEEGVREMVHSLAHSLNELRKFDISQIENLDQKFNNRLANTFKGLDDLLKTQLVYIESKKKN